MLSLEFAERSDIGRIRDHNEDCLGHVIPASAAKAHEHGWLFALADGVGGHERGEIASRLAIDTVISEFVKIPKGIMHVSLLPKLIQEANCAVFAAGTATTGNADHSGAESGTDLHKALPMASTLVLCALRFDSAVISHVGDSRCYLFRNRRLASLTHDHTIASEQVSLGILSEEGGFATPNRHILTRSLGSEMFVAADTITVNLIPGDVLMLCSDGLHGSIPNAAMQQILASETRLDSAADELIVAANDAGGEDNVSVQLVRIHSVERMGLYRGRPYRLL